MNGSPSLIVEIDIALYHTTQRCPLLTEILTQCVRQKEGAEFPTKLIRARKSPPCFQSSETHITGFHLRWQLTCPTPPEPSFLSGLHLVRTPESSPIRSDKVRGMKWKVERWPNPELLYEKLTS